MTDPTSTAVPDDLRRLNPGWKQIVLVCKACEKRKKGPKKLGAKKVARALGPALRQAGQPRTLIVPTGCLRLCPKRAITVAACAPGGGLQVMAWDKRTDADAAVRVLFGVGTVDGVGGMGAASDGVDAVVMDSEGNRSGAPTPGIKPL